MGKIRDKIVHNLGPLFYFGVMFAMVLGFSIWRLSSHDDNNGIVASSSTYQDQQHQAAAKLSDRDRLSALWYYQSADRNKALVDQSVGLAQKLFDRMISGKLPYKISGPGGPDEKAPADGPASMYLDRPNQPSFTLTVTMKKGKPTLVTDHAFLSYHGGLPTTSWRFGVDVEYGQYSFTKNGNEHYSIQYPSTNTIMDSSTLLDFDKVAGVTYCANKYPVGATAMPCQYVDTATIKDIDRYTMFIVDDSLTPFLIDN